MPTLPSALSSIAEATFWLGIAGHRWAVGILLALSLWLSPVHVGGQTAPDKTILLVRTAGDDPVMNRIRADLKGAGWRIVEVARWEGPEAPKSLEALATQLAVTAALRVDALVSQVEIHIGRSSGNIDEIVRGQDGQVDGRVLAWRTTEALRAHGLDIGPTAAPELRSETCGPVESQTSKAQKPREAAASRPTANHRTAPAPAVAASTQPMQRSQTAWKEGLWLEMAPAATVSPGGMGYGVSGWVGARFELSAFWSVVSANLIPLQPRWVLESEGGAQVFTYLFAAGVEGAWLRRLRWYCATGLGAGGLLTVMQGVHAQTGYRTAADTVGTAAFHLYLRSGLHLESDWTLFSVLLGGMSLPEVKIGFGDRVVRTWGQPYLMLALGAGFQPIAW